MGLPEFDNAPLKKHRSWRPPSPQEEDNREVLYLMGRIKTLAKSGLTIIEVMSICIMRGVQPLQYRGKPMWHFNGEDDATRCSRKGPDSATEIYTLSLHDALPISPERRESPDLYGRSGWHRLLHLSATWISPDIEVAALPALYIWT